MSSDIWGDVAHSKSLVGPVATGRRFKPANTAEHACLDVLAAMGLLPDWQVEDFTAAMVIAIASASALEKLRLIQVYPQWVYYIEVLQVEGPDRLLVIADLAEV